MACAKTIRKRDKALSRIRRDKEARKRKIKRQINSRSSSKAKPGYWLDAGTADIHAAIIEHLRVTTRELVKNLVCCKVTGPHQAYRSDLAFRSESAFLAYNKITINGDKLGVTVEITPRTTPYQLPRRFSPIWGKEYQLILSDPGLFDKLRGIAAEMASNYYQLVEPNHGA